ncbi:MAG: hypothetical protein QM757_47040 [Paludibaculum sp.]
MWGAAAGGPVTPTFHIFASVEGNQQTRGAFIQSPTPTFYPGHQKQWFGLVNMDKRWSDNQSLYLRLNAHSSVGDNSNDAVGGFVQPSAARRDAGQNYGLQATHRWIMSPTHVNELRVGSSKSVPLSYYAVNPQTQIVRPSYSTEGLSDYFDSRVLHLAGQRLYTPGSSAATSSAWAATSSATSSATSPPASIGSYRMAAGAPRPGETPVQFTQTFGAAPVRYGDTLASAFVQDDWRLARPHHSQSRTALRLPVHHRRPQQHRPPLRLRLGRPRFRPHRRPWRRRPLLRPDVPPGRPRRPPAGTRVATGHLHSALRRRRLPTFPNSLTAPPTGSGDRRALALFPENRLNPYTGQFSFGVQQVLGRDWTLSMNVSHMLSRKQQRVLDINAPSPFLRTAAGQRRTATVADATRPFTTYEGVPVRTIGVFENTGSSRYTAFDAQLSKRFTRRFQMNAHYLYSSSITYVFFTGGPNTGVPSDWNNRGIDERGPNDYFQRHRFTAQGIYELPYGLQLSAFLIAASGLPVNPLTGVDNNGDGNVLDRPVGLGRNSYRAPYQNTVDISLLKRIPITERVRAELRVEGTNLLNRSNYLKVNATYGDTALPLASFLQPVAGLANSDPARQLQVGVRFIF